MKWTTLIDLFSSQYIPILSINICLIWSWFTLTNINQFLLLVQSALTLYSFYTAYKTLKTKQDIDQLK